jgi:hypothetical protein
MPESMCGFAVFFTKLSVYPAAPNNTVLPVRMPTYPRTLNNIHVDRSFST